MNTTNLAQKPNQKQDVNLPAQSSGLQETRANAMAYLQSLKFASLYCRKKISVILDVSFKRAEIAVNLRLGARNV